MAEDPAVITDSKDSTSPGRERSGPTETPLEFQDQLEEKWPQIVRDLELPRGLLQRIETLDMDGKLQAVLAWLKERHTEKTLATAIVRALPGEEQRWEQEVRDALEKASTATALTREGTPSTGYHSHGELGTSAEYSFSLESTGSMSGRTLSYSKNGIIAGPLSGTQETKSPTWRCSVKQRQKVCAAVCCCLIVFVGVITTGIAGLFTLAFFETNESNTQIGYQGDTIVAGRADGFWYKEFDVSQEAQSNHSIQLDVIHCHDQQTQILSGTQENLTFSPLTETHTLAAQYLLPGSNIRYDMCVTANDSADVSASFFAFDTYSAFMDFFHGRDNGLGSSVLHQNVELLETSEDCRRFSVEHTAVHHAYYFHAIRFSRRVMGEYNITSTIKHLNRSDFIASCTVTRSQSCDLSFGSEFLGTSGDYCLLAFFDSDVSVSSLIAYIRVETKRRYTVLVIPAVVLAVGITGLTVLCLCCCVSLKRRSTKRVDSTSGGYAYM